jgi:hypothetical protein
MNKLLEKFKALGSVKNAKALIEYEQKHPMASCMLSDIDHQWLKSAHDTIQNYKHLNS